jgi:hypothetical protein
MATSLLTPSALNIHSRTDLVRAKVRLEACREISAAHYAVEWARQTGRINGTAELAIRSLSGYQYAKLVLAAHQRMQKEYNMEAIARWMDTTYGK